MTAPPQRLFVAPTSESIVHQSGNHIIYQYATISDLPPKYKYAPLDDVEMAAIERGG
jgi:hypothetical protein